MSRSRVRVSPDTLGTGFHHVQLTAPPYDGSRNIGITADGNMTITFRRDELRELRDILLTLNLDPLDP